MKISALNSISKLYFSYEELAGILGISEASARVSANRYAKQGLLIRIRRNLYILPERWHNLTTAERFSLVNLALSPSYISLLTALAYYEITTQVQPYVVESLALKRSKEISVDGFLFTFRQIRTAFFNGFDRTQGVFIASPEKALLDTLYFVSLGRYSLDRTALDTGKLDLRKLRKLAQSYPTKTRKLLTNCE